MLTWAPPFAFAPLEGIGHPVFLRQIAERGGVGLVAAPFLPVGRAPVHAPTLRRRMPQIPGIPLSVQLLGEDPDRMARAAEVVVAAGAKVVDLNLGCPARRVVARGAGAALLRSPERIQGLVARLRAVVPGTLSAKMRAGFTDASLLLDNAAAVEAGGADFLVVHARTRDQGYRGVAEWQWIREVCEHVSLPVVGNGDCWYAADALRLLQDTGCAGVMIGRPAVRNPWIFAQIDALRRGAPPTVPTGEELARWLHELADRYVDALAHRPRLVLGKLKEVIRYVGTAVDDGGVFRRAALRAPDLSTLRQRVNGLLAPLPPARLDLGPDGPRRLMRSGGLS